MNSLGATGFPAGPLARRESFRHSALDAVEAHLNRHIIPHRLVSLSGRPRGQFGHGIVDFGDFSLSRVRYDFEGGRLRVDCPAMDDDYRFQVTVAGSGCTGDGSAGLPFGPNGFVIIHPNRPFHECFESRCLHLLLTVRRDAIERAFVSLSGRALPGRLRFEASVVEVDGRGQSFIRRLAALCRSLDGERLRPVGRHASDPAVEALMHAVLLTLPHNYSALLCARPERMAPDYVRRVQDYLVAHAREDVAIEDLVRAAGCSARSIYHGFKRHEGRTPMRYLRDYRLALSRDELLNADRTGRTVSETALSCGFTHMSKFAALYRQRFHESPSATRRRALSPDRYARRHPA
jgi:AraC-like DNA-binding protein